MTKLHTRLCTLPFRGSCPKSTLPSFVRRPTKKTFEFTQRAVQTVRDITPDEARETIQRLIQVSLEDKENARVVPGRARKTREPWEDKVNRKRRLIARCIVNYPKKSLSWISRETRTDLATVRRTQVELQEEKTIQPYTYNNLKPHV